MAPLTPYTYIQCPCSDTSFSPSGAPTSDDKTEPEDDDRTFDPRAPRANYSLYPLEYLLYCEDCHQIRCPRCVNEEIVTYYCPSCLFEVPSSNLKTEGNRCTRSCFQCPICIGPLVVTSLEAPPEPTLLAADNTAQPTGPYVLTCSYCNWSSTEIGIQFDKPNGIYQQLAKMSNGGKPRLTAKEFRERSRKEKEGDPESPSSPLTNSDVDAELQFSQLKAFYQSQLNETNPQAAAGLGSLADLGISSPGSLSRIMSMYTGAGHGASHKQSRGRLPVMREARTLDEGFQEADLDDSALIEKLRASAFEDTASTDQRLAQQPSLPSHHPLLFVDDLRPIPYLLRTKRSKRCPVCRHIISKPESKISNPRFRIRLIAGSYIPTITVRPFHAPESHNVPSGLRPPVPAELWLAPHRASQYVLTFQNPIFEPVKVTLAAPAATPGRFASTVTVLCPQFDISANTDMWDDALKEEGEVQLQLQRRRAGEDGGPAQPEPGKIWERGRNWVSIVVEVVPASLRLDGLPPGPGGEEPDRSPLKEDEDVLEIPMFVRVEWEADTRDDVGSSTTTRDNKEAREKRELAYWCVLGLGRIARG
ncbi:hypothetical protein SODALDRAFT_316365 [Sodiomyces alkalinus F11]|uniref:Dynactin subunit 4 n=1 Tax=Sodiomyces alkalinus (strain CBS 110278 / VKM F-3762 / F11) TaxID=1314773 RepID=A0A3N2PNI0_SODAK|nr:hypothetical protein SODALDRAFT_316365 [Sodiomyces alkalinus F11]ROT36078.1 hypothetical protein SODALDRAFT_316365 [Sodiomyces alkalinus F11]